MLKNLSTYILQRQNCKHMLKFLKFGEQISPFFRKIPTLHPPYKYRSMYPRHMRSTRKKPLSDRRTPVSGIRYPSGSYHRGAPSLHTWGIWNNNDLYAESGQTLQGSFSAVSKSIFASKYSLESSRRDLHNALLCTALERSLISNFS